MRGMCVMIAASAVLFTVAGCTEENMACVPGSTQTCVCLGGGSGVQTCSTDGARYEACKGCTEKDPDGGKPDVGKPDGLTDGVLPDSGPCGAGKSLCNGKCVDLQQDSNNCGSCGNVC